MPDLDSKKSVIILCDSWHAKSSLASVVDEYTNLDIICNGEYDSVIYAPAPERTGRRGRAVTHGR